MAIRDLIKSLSPSWLQGGRAERYLYTIGLVGGDGLLEKMTQASHAHMPLKADATALPYIGNDLLTPRGLTESDASYRVRLQRAIDMWHIAGNAWSVLAEALAFVLAKQPIGRTVSNTYSATGASLIRSLWNSYAAAADTSKPPTYLRVEPGNWDWDSVSPTTNWGWFRWWLVLEAVAPHDWCGPAPFKWGTLGVKIGQRPDASIGLNVPPKAISGLRAIVKLRQAAHSWCRNIIVSFDSALFDPAQPSGGGVNPDGTFGHWGKMVSNQYVPARFANARYCYGAILGE